MGTEKQQKPLQFTASLPPEKLEYLRKSSQKNRHSMNGEVIYTLQDYFER
jgi:hypothetical protein